MKPFQIATVALLAVALSAAAYAQHVQPQVDVQASLATGQGAPPANEPGQMVIPNPSDPSLSLVQAWPIDYSTGLYETGTVVIVLTVIPGGYPTDPVVETSSGYFELDSTAQAAVMQWRFHPARRAGKEVPSYVRIPITLSASHPPPAALAVAGQHLTAPTPAPSANSPPQSPAGEKTHTKVAHAIGAVVSFLVETAAGVAEAQAAAPARQPLPQTRTPLQRYQAPTPTPSVRPVVKTDCTASDFGGTHVSCVSH